MFQNKGYVFKNTISKRKCKKENLMRKYLHFTFIFIVRRHFYCKETFFICMYLFIVPPYNATFLQDTKIAVAL